MFQNEQAKELIAEMIELLRDKDKIIKHSIFVRLMVTVIPLDLLPLHIEKLVHRQRSNSKLSVCVIAPQEDHNRV